MEKEYLLVYILRAGTRHTYNYAILPDLDFSGLLWLLAWAMLCKSVCSLGRFSWWGRSGNPFLLRPGREAWARAMGPPT